MERHTERGRKQSGYSIDPRVDNINDYREEGEEGARLSLVLLVLMPPLLLLLLHLWGGDCRFVFGPVGQVLKQKWNKVGRRGQRCVFPQGVGDVFVHFS